MTNRVCTGCKEEKPLDLDHFYKCINTSGFHTKCKVCRDAYTKAYYKKYPDRQKKTHDAWKTTHKEELWASNIKRSHNTSSDEYYSLLKEQNGLCAVCLKPPINNEKLRIDHDHNCCPSSKRSCGKCKRGLVHHKCNAAIGMLNDDPVVCRLAASYLEARRVS